jgi:hypothetical protein
MNYGLNDSIVSTLSASVPKGVHQTSCNYRNLASKQGRGRGFTDFEDSEGTNSVTFLLSRILNNVLLSVNPAAGHVRKFAGSQPCESEGMDDSSVLGRQKGPDGPVPWTDSSIHTTEADCRV